MKDNEKKEETASERFQLIAPLLSVDLDPARTGQIKKDICEKYGISDRTLRRYLACYRERGLEGLKPKGRSSKGHAISPSLVEEAILLRREVPQRSISQIIQILEWEDKAQPGELKRSTLQDRLTARGYSSRQMRLYRSTVGAARRFQKLHRNKLWQSDIK